MDDGVDRNTWTRFLDDLVGIVGVEVGEIRAVDDVHSAGTGLGGGGCFVVAGGVGGGVVGRERFVWDDCLRGGGRRFCGGLFRVTGGYLGVSRGEVRCMKMEEWGDTTPWIMMGLQKDGRVKLDNMFCL